MIFWEGIRSMVGSFGDWRSIGGVDCDDFKSSVSGDISISFRIGSMGGNWTTKYSFGDCRSTGDFLRTIDSMGISTFSSICMGGGRIARRSEGDSFIMRRLAGGSFGDWRLTGGADSDDFKSRGISVSFSIIRIIAVIWCYKKSKFLPSYPLECQYFLNCTSSLKSFSGTQLSSLGLL